MDNDKIATFFGGAIPIITPEYEETVEIGKFLASEGYTVKCGGYRGLMEAISLGVSTEGGTIIGYTCKTFHSTMGNKFLTKTVVCDDIYDRLKQLIVGSDIIIVHSGGIGTLTELMLVLDENRKNRTQKIFVIGSYMKEKLRFLDDKDYYSIIFCETVQDFREKINIQ